MLRFAHKIFFNTLTLLALALPTASSAIFKTFLQQETQTTNALTFLSSIEKRKKQLTDLQQISGEINKKTEEKNKTVTEAINKLNRNLDQVKNKLKEDKKDEEEFLNKRISILNDLKQILLTRQELIKEVPNIITKHVDLIKTTVGFLQGRNKKNLKSVYSWKEFKEAQGKEVELLEAVENEKNKKDSVQKQQLSEKEALSSLTKQVDVKEKERDKVVAALKTTTEESPASLRQQQELLDDEISLTKEKIATAEQSILKLGYELQLHDDQVDLLQSKISHQKELLVITEKRLVLDINDIELARTEANDENQKSLSVKEEISKKIEAKKLDKGHTEPRINFLTKHLEEIKNAKQESARSKIDYYLAQSDLKKQTARRNNIEREIGVLNAKIDLADADTNTKNLFYQTVSLRYKLSRGKEDLDSLLAKFKNQKDIETNILKKLQDSNKEATKALISANNELESIKIKVESFKEKDELFTENNNALKKISKNYDDAKQNLEEQLQFNNKYLAINADLINSREKIINQYSLIIQHIENHKLLQGIWKRSPKAITFDEFKRSWLDAESFFTQLFWDTPAHLGPATLLKSVKNISFSIAISILLFLLFYMICFFVLRYALLFIYRKAKNYLRVDSRRFSFLPLNILISILDFSQNHFKLIFTCFFLWLHISFDFHYCFSTINFLQRRYYIALFYLVTIPVLVNLSRHFLASLKELNRRLSFLFFAEKIQDKFILLITCFCYSTALFIPLRFAFLTYFSHDQTVFQDVLLAAYSLTLVVVLLLFFSKEDVLRLIPSGKAFLTWLKQQTDKHYYPVFFFLMGLLILSNPYIGYSNMAWYLAFAVPCTILLFYALFIAHFYTRKYAVFMFMKEDEEEIIDKFEHAKTYYGIFVIFSFLLLLFVTFIFVTRIWGYSYTPGDIWKNLADVWVIPIGTTYKLGIIELGILALFVTGGFLVSSLANKFVLNKLYDILRTEPGTQNTISKIMHYLSISLATCFGFIFIHLEGFIWYIGTLLAVGLGFALKDIMTDYVAGFFVLIERPIEIGSFIRLDHHPHMLGTVHKIDARTTTIMTRINHSIIVPNKDLINKPIVNWGKGRFAVGFEMQINVDYNSDPEVVRQSIIEVIQANPTVLRVPNIVVRLEEFEESALRFLTRAFISSRRVRDQWDVAAAIRMGIIKLFRERDIEFSFPQRVLHMGERKGPDNEPEEKPKGPIDIKFDSP